MNINLIKTENDYNQALERLEIIFDAKKGTIEGDELELLGILINPRSRRYAVNIYCSIAQNYILCPKSRAGKNKKKTEAIGL